VRQVQVERRDRHHAPADTHVVGVLRLFDLGSFAAAHPVVAVAARIARLVNNLVVQVLALARAPDPCDGTRGNVDVEQYIFGQRVVEDALRDER